MRFKIEISETQTVLYVERPSNATSASNLETLLPNAPAKARAHGLIRPAAFIFGCVLQEPGASGGVFVASVVVCVFLVQIQVRNNIMLFGWGL